MDTGQAIQLSGLLAFIEEWLSRALTIFTRQYQWASIWDITGTYEMGVITVSPVYLHLLAWLTSDHRGKKPADMAGHQRGGGGEGGPTPKMQTSQMPKQKIDLCTPYKLVQSLPFCETQKQQLIKSWTRNLGENEDGWVEKLKPTMMNWCVLCLL